MAEEDLRAVAKREAEELCGPTLGGPEAEVAKVLAWSANDSAAQKTSQQPDEEAKMDQATVELIKAVTKMCIRHEEELGRLRTETNFMCFCDVPWMAR